MTPLTLIGLFEFSSSVLCNYWSTFLKKSPHFYVLEIMPTVTFLMRDSEVTLIVKFFFNNAVMAEKVFSLNVTSLQVNAL